MEYAVRSLKSADRTAAERLWRERFDDPESFVRFFFARRYAPGLSAGAFDGETLVSAIHGMKTSLNLRGIPVPALLVSGVATAVGYERRGLMHLCMRKIYRIANANGCPVVFHRPESFRTYASLSQLPGTDTGFAPGRGDPAKAASLSVPCAAYGDLSGAGMPEGAPAFDEIRGVYAACMLRYSGSVLRSEAEMRLRMEDYASCGGRLLPLRKGGRLSGYAVFDEDGGCPEAVAEDMEGYRELLDRIPAGCMAKIPPDVFDALPETYRSGGKRVQGNAYGAADVPALLRFVSGDPEAAFDVREPVLSENTGLFDGTGKRLTAGEAESVPQEKITVLSGGELVQRAIGYGTAPAGMPCWCVDEY